MLTVKRNKRRLNVITAMTAVLAMLACMSGGFTAPAPALAAERTVTNLNDSGAGSLRQAIQDANSNPGADLITFQLGLAGTIALGSQLPALTDDLTIRGPGSKVISISGQDQHRIFRVNSGTVRISGLTLKNGKSQGYNGSNSEIFGGAGGGGAGAGGALLVMGGSVFADDVVFMNNEARGGNGGSSGQGHSPVGGSGGHGLDGTGGGAGGDPNFQNYAGGAGADFAGGGGGGMRDWVGANGGSGGYGGGGGGGGTGAFVGSGGAGGFGGGNGGNGVDEMGNKEGGGGGGGAGLGGAVFVNAGSLVITNATFLGNTVAGGSGGNMAGNGQGLAHAVFNRNGSVTAGGVVYDNGTNHTYGTIDALSPPVLSGVNPAAAAIGDTVTITGENLWGATVVTLGGVRADTFVVLSDTEIQAVVDADASGDAVTVTTPAGTASLNASSFTSNNADLGDLQVSPGNINPVFSPKTVAYAVYAPAGLRSIDVTAVPADPSATLTIDSQPAQSSVSSTVYLDQGANLIPVVVTAEDGVTQKAYILSVNGTVSDADLSSLAVTPGSLSFDPDVTSYNLAVDSSVSSLTLTAGPHDPRALVLVNGGILADGATRSIDLNEGETVITILVVAQDASTKTYTISVNRSLPLAITTGSLPVGIVGAAYNAALAAQGGAGGYTWSASGLPASLAIDSGTGRITGTPVASDVGTYAVAVTVTDAGGAVFTADYSLRINLGCGNGAYLIVPDTDPAYTAGLTADGIPVMTVENGVSGFKYFSVTVTPVTGHTGRETAVFVHLRNGMQLGLATVTADFDTADGAQVAFNVRPGDVVKAYLVDNVTNDPGTNPVVL